MELDMSDLKLLALDSEDLEVISTHAQDAIVRVGDMGYAQSDNRFALLLNRYVWDKNPANKNNERRRSALHFDNVKSIKITGIDSLAKDGMLNLLAIIFEASDLPSGKIILTFAGGGTVSLMVETIEARLSDLGAAWATKTTPSHKEE